MDHSAASCGITGSAFCTRPQWLTGEHIVHPYTKPADGRVVDAVRNRDKSSPDPGAPAGGGSGG